MIQLELTPKVKEWLDTDPEKRDILAGAQLLLQITRNQILYNNIVRRPEDQAPLLEYHLTKILKTRLIDTTKAEVQQMMVQVNAIAERRGLNRQERSAFQNGKRPTTTSSRRKCSASTPTMPTSCAACARLTHASA